MDKTEELIWKETLKNAVKFKGAANSKAILGKIMGGFPDLRSKANEIKPLVEQIVDQVNHMNTEEQTKKLLSMDPHALDPEEKKEIVEKRLPDLPGAEKGKVVMRMAPYPSGALHIGNARMIILNDEYTKMYQGRLILVFDDTIGTTLAEMHDSKAKFVVPESYDLIKEGLEWLGVKYHAQYYKSDRVEIYQNEAQNFIREGLA